VGAGTNGVGVGSTGVGVGVGVGSDPALDLRPSIAAKKITTAAMPKALRLCMENLLVFPGL
jgi:hypothetical protein